MGFAEDSRKVQRIVAGSFLGLQRMYLPLMQVCAVHSLHSAHATSMLSSSSDEVGHIHDPKSC